MAEATLLNSEISYYIFIIGTVPAKFDELIEILHKANYSLRFKISDAGVLNSEDISPFLHCWAITHQV